MVITNKINLEEGKHFIFLEIRGILRSLSDVKGQGIVSKKRALELIKFLKNIE